MSTTNNQFFLNLTSFLIYLYPISLIFSPFLTNSIIFFIGIYGLTNIKNFDFRSLIKNQFIICFLISEVLTFDSAAANFIRLSLSDLSIKDKLIWFNLKLLNRYAPIAAWLFILNASADNPENLLLSSKSAASVMPKSKLKFRIFWLGVHFNNVPKSNFTFGKFLSYIIVLIISFIGFIIFLDTFRFQLFNLYPDLEIFLFSFYETLKDIQLFIIDLM